jgi:septum formation protein
MQTVYLASQSPRRRQLLEQLSASMGFQVELLAPTPSEDAEALEGAFSNEHPKDYVQRVTSLKLQAGIARLGQRDEEVKGANGLITAPTTAKATSEWPAVTEPSIVLASDTTVALDDEIFGKPLDADDARRMLKRLSGRGHWVHTGVAIAVAIAWPAIGSLTGHGDSKAQQVSETMGSMNDEHATRNWQFKQALSSSKVHFADLTDAWIDWVIQTGEPMDKAGAYAIQGHAGSMIKRVEGSPTGIMGLPLHETAELLRLALAST